MVGEEGSLVAVSPDRGSRWVAVAKMEKDGNETTGDNGVDGVIEKVTITVWDTITQHPIRQIIQTYPAMSTFIPIAHLAKYTFTNDLTYLVVNYATDFREEPYAQIFHRIRAYKLI